MNWRRLILATVAGVILALGPVLAVVRRPSDYEMMIVALCILLGILVGLAPVVVLLTVRAVREAKRSPAPDAPAGPDA